MFDISALKAVSQDVAAPEPGGLYDVAIVGGGPAGATAALYAARSDLKTVVLDRSVAAGALAITSKIANYPGIPGVVSGIELLRIIRGQAESFGAQFVNAQVVSASLRSSPKELQTSAGQYRAMTAMIATGKMGRKSRIPGEDEFLGRGVSYCATCDAAFFRGEAVALIGSSREAVEEAELVARFARKLYLIAPGGRFQAEPARLDRLESEYAVEIRRNQGLREVIGEETVTGIKLSKPPAEEETLDVAGVFIYLPGNAPAVDFAEGELELTEQGCVKVNQERATNIPGVYAIGDVTCSYVQQAVVAAADGAIAAMAAEKYLRGRGKARSDWA